MSSKSLQRGYSLVESVIYIGILAAMMGVVFHMLVGIAHSREKVNAAQRVTASAITSLDRLTRELKSARRINTASSTLGVHPGKLVLESNFDDGTARVVEFSLVSGVLYLKENGIDQGPLTQNNARVTTLIFTRSSISTNESVRVEIRLESGTSTTYKSERFYTTAVLRQSL
jgi:type II secretory pathway pseudopilin PulG